MSTPRISTIATFPPGFFLENIATLPDDSLLVTVANRKELYCLPPPANPDFPRTPILLERFSNDAWPFGLALAHNNPSLVYLLTTDFTSQGSHTHHIRFLDISNVAQACHCVSLAEFPASAKGLNGLVALSETVLLAADSFAGYIWRIDVELDEQKLPINATITEWFRDPTLAGELVLPDFQPGVNGLKYSPVAEAVCFSSTQQKLFGKIPIDPGTWRAVGKVEVLHREAQGDDLIVDDGFEGGPVAYLATHRDNSILRIPIGGSEGAVAGASEIIAEGSKEFPHVLGPTAGVWKWGAEGRTAYFTCDGGLKKPIEGEPPRFARVLQIDF